VALDFQNLVNHFLVVPRERVTVMRGSSPASYVSHLFEIFEGSAGILESPLRVVLVVHVGLGADLSFDFAELCFRFLGFDVGGCQTILVLEAD
jgi:hypothetical protein